MKRFLKELAKKSCKLNNNYVDLLACVLVGGGGNLELAPQGFRGLEKEFKRCYYSDMIHHCDNKKAFTLAEVLITLGIIGVVVALTMPALIANYQKKQTIAQLKKAYSILNQAYERSVLENGDVETWDWQGVSTPESFAQIYIIPYLKGVNKMNTSKIKWLALDKSNIYGFDICSDYILPDGMIIKFTSLVGTSANLRKTHLQISIDINGDRGPNRFGRDVFVFSIFPFSEQSRGKVVPGTNDQCGNGAIHNELTRDQLTTSGCATCKSDYTGYGYGCAALIMKDGWEIKDDYPW